MGPLCSLSLSVCFFSHSVSLSLVLFFFLCLTILFHSIHFALFHHPRTLPVFTQTPSDLVLLVYYIHVSICLPLWLIETGAVKRPHMQPRESRYLTTRLLRFDGLVPELASPWRGSALGFPVNEALCGWEGYSHKGFWVKEKKKVCKNENRLPSRSDREQTHAQTHSHIFCLFSP